MSPKIERFCLEYFKTFNYQKALAIAGYHVKPTSVNASAFRLISRPDVQEYMSKLMHKIENKAVVSVQNILDHLQEMAFFDIASILDSDGDIKPPDQWPPIASKIIAEYTIEVTKHIYEEQENRVVQVQVKRIKIPDRVRNTENLGRYLSMFTDNINSKSSQEVKVFFIPKFDDPDNIHTREASPASERAGVEHIKILPEPHQGN